MKKQKVIEVPLSQGKVALVDEDDFEKFIKHKKYYAHKKKDEDTFYVRRGEHFIKDNGEKSTKTIMLHREIMNPPEGMEVDHIDRDGLNNCKSNLRIVTGSQNQQNENTAKFRQDNLTKRLKNCEGVGSSRFVGVVHRKKHTKRPWQAQSGFKTEGATKYLGTFKNEWDAGKAVDEYRISQGGEAVNFPKEDHAND